MPQTRFVLEKALAQDPTVIIVINKVDRPDARLDEVVDEVLELMLDLGASDEQLDAPVVFCSARQGAASFSPHQFGSDLKPLFDTILEHIAPPEGDERRAAGHAGLQCGLFLLCGAHRRRQASPPVPLSRTCR